LLCVVAVAVALPWYIRAWVYTGNPLFPMFHEFFAAIGFELERWDAQAQAGWNAAMARYGAGRSAVDLVLVPWRATWDGARFAGSIGPAWLLFLPLVPLTWRRFGVDLRLLMALLAVYYLLWISPYSSFQIRYLVPAVPLAAVVVTAVVRNLAPLFAKAGIPVARRMLLGGVALMLFLNLPVFYPLHDARSGWISSTFHSVRPHAWATVLGLYDPDRYLARRVQPYAGIQFLNEAAPAGARVVSFAQAAHFYSRQRVIADYSRVLADGTWGAGPGEEEAAYRALRAVGVEYIVWDRVRTDLSDERFAIRSAEFRSRFSVLIYADYWVEIDELLPRETTQ
jgi:hypothetical protein